MKICSTYKALIYELEHLRKVALANSCPPTFIEQHISRRLEKYIQLQQQKHTENIPKIVCEKEKIYFELPYTGNVTEILKMKLTWIVKKYRPALESCFYTRSPQTITALFKVKDTIHKFYASKHSQAKHARSYAIVKGTYTAVYERMQSP